MRNRHRQAMAKSASALSHQGKCEHAAVYWFMTMFSFLFHSYLLNVPGNAGALHLVTSVVTEKNGKAIEILVPAAGFVIYAKNKVIG